MRDKEGEEVKEREALLLEVAAPNKDGVPVRLGSLPVGDGNPEEDKTIVSDAEPLKYPLGVEDSVAKTLPVTLREAAEEEDVQPLPSGEAESAASGESVAPLEAMLVEVPLTTDVAEITPLEDAHSLPTGVPESVKSDVGVAAPEALPCGVTLPAEGESEPAGGVPETKIEGEGSAVGVSAASEGECTADAVPAPVPVAPSVGSALREAAATLKDATGLTVPAPVGRAVAE